MRFGLILFALLFSIEVSSQDDLLIEMQEEADNSVQEKVIATFKAIKLINANTNELVKAKTLDFRITHRFGNIGVGAGGGIHTLYGFDTAENIRFSFDYGVTDKLTLGFGRSKTKEHLDFNIKYEVLAQDVREGSPISLVVYSNIALTPERDVNQLYSKFTNRMSYAHQLIIARKFSSNFSMMILPTYLHRNFVITSINDNNDAYESNDLFALGLGGRIKLTHRVSLVAEYYYNFSKYRMNNPSNPYYNHLGLGVEIETGGHVFHLNLTNSSGIILNDYLVNTSDTWANGGFKFGFNISRVFNIGGRKHLK